MSTRVLWWAPFAMLLVAGVSRGQTQLNPQFSAIGDMRYVVRDDVARALAGTNTAAFEFNELELTFAGYLNPYARADVFVAVDGVEGPVSVEEVYASIVRGLPVQLRFGKYFSNFSRLLAEHPHQFAWGERPLMHQAVFGEEGAPLIGARISKLLGVGDTALILSADAFRSDFFETAQPALDAPVEDDSSGNKHDLGWMGRASVFRELGDALWLDVGGSFMWSEYDPTRQLNTRLYGFDTKLKWRPDTYKAARLIVEIQFSDRDVKNDSTEVVSGVASFGAFVAAEVKFRKRYDTGGFFDFTQDPNDENLATTAVGGWIGFMPAEESIRFSLIYRHETSDAYEGSAQSVFAQVLFALGPHKAHQF